MSRETPVEEFVTGIDYPQPFDDYVIDLCATASRYVCILSPTLDHAVFDSEELVATLSALARATRQTQVRILLRDKREVVSRGHKLVNLARRLPSTVHIQRLDEHPDWNDETIVVRDRNGVLYKPGDSDTNAFYEPDSRASTQRHLNLFEDLWRFSVKDPDLRRLDL
ncbi:MAG: hypothetical protein R3228_17385 [Halioglobus sp.]|nr:hypothetical protein [Halioglobus sp.]